MQNPPPLPNGGAANGDAVASTWKRSSSPTFPHSFRTVVRSSGFVVLLLAISIGLIGNVHPNLFFRIPKVGFILWAVTGNRMPPYFDSTPMQEEYFHQWAKDGDCIVSSMAKSGSVWLHAIINLLKTGGSDEGHLFHNHIGTTEMLFYPEHTLDIRLNETQAKRVLAQNRPVPALTHFTHYATGGDLYGLDVTLHRKIKYVVIMRNGREVVRSFREFVNTRPPRWRKMWGGYPPGLATPEAAVEFTTSTVPTVVFGHKTWWDVRHEPNVLLLHFNDLKDDTERTVKRIAAFLDIPLSTNLLKTVLYKSSFHYMKARDTANPGTYMPVGGRPWEEPIEHVASHLHQGRNDGAWEFFTEDMLRRWEVAVERYWGDMPDLIRWAEKGGAIK